MRIGEYELLDVLGGGGAGTVYRARTRQGALVALKLIKRGGGPRVERERRILGALGASDEGFVPLLDEGEAPEGAYLVMPLVPGGSLRDRLRRSGSLSPDEAVTLVRKIARALGRAHSLGIVHRDLKPENILIDGDGEPLVADLGLAKHFNRDALGGSQSRAITEAGALVGTFAYMSPEQTFDSTAVDATADVYALGSILYECLAGRPPFSVDPPLFVILEKKGAGDFEPLSDAAPGIPRWIASVVDAAMSRDPSRRPRDGSELAQLLEARSSSGRGWIAVAAVALALPVVGALVAVAGTQVREMPNPTPPRPSSPASSLARAEALVAARDWTDAEAELDRVIAREPSLARAWLLRGRTRSAVARTPGDLKGAVRADLDRAVALAPRDADAWAERAEARFAIGDATGAAADAATAEQLDPRNALAIAVRGEVLLFRGNVAEGGVVLEQALAIDPKNVPALRSLGIVKIAGHDFERALGLFERALALLDERSFWTRKVQVDHAEACVLSGDYDRAIAEFTKVVESREDVVIMTKLGRLENLKGDTAHAIAHLSRAVALEPTDGEAWAHLANARVTTGDPAGALDAGARALALPTTANEFRIEAHLSRGKAMLTTNDWGAAIPELDRALVLLQGHPSVATVAEAHSLRGIARTMIGELDAAAEDLTEAIRLNPQHPTAHFNRGVVHARRALAAGSGTPSGRAELDLAIDDYTKALEREPGAPVWGNRGHALLLRGDRARARSDLERAVALDPKGFEAWGDLASIKLDDGDVAGAIADATRAAALDPHWLIFLGKARRTGGDVPGAIKDVERFLANAKSDDPSVAGARALLDELRGH